MCSTRHKLSIWWYQYDSSLQVFGHDLSGVNNTTMEPSNYSLTSSSEYVRNTTDPFDSSLNGCKMWRTSNVHNWIEVRDLNENITESVSISSCIEFFHLLSTDSTRFLQLLSTHWTLNAMITLTFHHIFHVGYFVCWAIRLESIFWQFFRVKRSSEIQQSPFLPFAFACTGTKIPKWQDQFLQRLLRLAPEGLFLHQIIVFGTLIPEALIFFKSCSPELFCIPVRSYTYKINQACALKFNLRVRIRIQGKVVLHGNFKLISEWLFPFWRTVENMCMTLNMMKN